MIESIHQWYLSTTVTFLEPVGREPGAVVKAACLESRKVGDRGFEPHSGLQVQRNKRFLPRSLIMIQYRGELS